SMGFDKLSTAVDGWMFDSDPGNIERLGHRRWCLNTAMKKTGLARSGTFGAMYTFDQSRPKLPAFDTVCFPCRGPMPLEFFGSKHAWSVSLNLQKYQPPGKDFVPKVFRADDAGAKTGMPLELDHAAVDPTPFGIPHCIIFRPANLKLQAGDRFVVEL